MGYQRILCGLDILTLHNRLCAFEQAGECPAGRRGRGACLAAFPDTAQLLAPDLQEEDWFCTGCFDGTYPIAVPKEMPKDKFESKIGE